MSRSIERHFRSRFPALNGEPWYEALVDAYVDAWDRDDEYRAEKVQDGIIETAMLCSVADPGGSCAFCDERKIELRYDGDQCYACVQVDDARDAAARQREAEWAAMTEEQRQEATRECALFMHGIIARDVQ